MALEPLVSLIGCQLPMLVLHKILVSKDARPLDKQRITGFVDISISTDISFLNIHRERACWAHEVVEIYKAAYRRRCFSLAD